MIKHRDRDGFLAQRTWFQLRATARAHRLHFDTHWAVTEARQQLHAHLFECGMFKRSWRSLGQPERYALQVVQAQGGLLPRWKFTRHFGTIRVCTQRRADSWHVPASIAEKLWLLGFVTLSPDRKTVSLSRETAALLPPLPLPQRRAPVHRSPFHFTRAALLVDLAALLGTLQRIDAAPTYGRWLSPSVLKTIDQALLWRGSLNGVRSQRRAGRLNFLLYLAETAGLTAVQNGFLKPTVSAWTWFTLSPDQQWDRLWRALDSDRRTGKLWTIYQLPLVDDSLWDALIHQLTALAPGEYDSESLVAALRPYCPALEPDQLALSVEMLLETVCAWIGCAAWEGDHIRVFTGDFPAPERGTWTITPSAFVIDLPDNPPPLAYAHLIGWCDSIDRRVILDESAMRAAVERGASALTLAETLATLVGTLSENVLHMFQSWETAAHALRLETMTILTAHDPAVLDHLCADRAIRPLIDKPLSRHHLVVKPEHAAELARKLHKRGHPITDHQPVSPPQPPTAELLAYCYLAVSTFKQLASVVTLPAEIPGAVKRWLADQLPPGKVDALDRLAAEAGERFTQTLHGHADAPPIAPDDPPGIESAIYQAYQTETAVEIEYFSPARGALTTRRVSPFRWYERGGARYFEAWCDLDSDARTFRLDRVLRVRSP